jgi:hypothetical protein
MLGLGKEQFLAHSKRIKPKFLGTYVLRTGKGCVALLVHHLILLVRGVVD